MPSTPRAPRATIDFSSIVVPEGRTHAYIASKDLRMLFDAALVGATKRPAGVFLFVGPSGSGKTDGAENLAQEANLDFTKVDAASMTDPEAWFGTREIVVQDGVGLGNRQFVAVNLPVAVNLLPGAANVSSVTPVEVVKVQRA